MRENKIVRVGTGEAELELGQRVFSNGDTNNSTSGVPHSYMHVPQICNTVFVKGLRRPISIQLDDRSGLTVHPKWRILNVRKAA
jgi:hypothetical protein